MTYQEAVKNQWAVAYHRMMFAKDPNKKTVTCHCDDCKEHFEALKSGEQASDQALSQNS